MSLSLCVIAKNEEKNIRRCIESVKDIVDEIILVDTGSTDNTVNIALEYGAKVYNYEWKDSFADARNYALERATKDWILIMDADDELSSEGKNKILDIINSDKNTNAYFFKTYSFVGEKPDENIIMNINIRLIRNYKGYRFIGDIHEQILPGPEDIGRKDAIKVGDIVFYHYGYLNSEIEEKEKRKRNMKILNDILEKNPHDSFMLFNMGCEYLALCDFNKALEYFKGAYKNFNPNLGYSPKLILRIASCYEYLGNYNEEFNIIEEGLKYYPNLTDLEFMRAKIHYIHGRYTLAIESLKKCLKMGDAPPFLGELIGSGTYKPLEFLSRIYLDLEDYEEALKYAKKAYKLNYNKENLLLIAKILFKTQTFDKAEDNIKRIIGKKADYVLMSEIFFEFNYFEKALGYVKLVQKNNKKEDINFYKGKYLFYMKKLNEAKDYLKKVTYNNYEIALRYIILIEILLNEFDEAIKYFDMLSEFNLYYKKTYFAFYQIIKNEETKILSSNKLESTKFIKPIFEILSILIKSGFYDEFEKALQLLNLIENDDVLVLLAKLYFENKAYGIALDEFKRSIKIFDKIDLEGIDMMKKCYLALM